MNTDKGEKVMARSWLAATFPRTRPRTDTLSSVFICVHLWFQRLFPAIATVLALPAIAQVTATDAWVRGTVAAQVATGAYVTLRSTEDAKLVAASSPAARRSEIHEMAMQGNVMQMREVSSLALPAGKAVELKPGGHHLMLFDLVKPLMKDDEVPITLTIEDKAGKKRAVHVLARVRPLTGGTSR